MTLCSMPELQMTCPSIPFQVSKVKGYTVASLENYSTLSNVSVFMRAGSRYETYDTLGLTHLLRRCAFLVSTVHMR